MRLGAGEKELAGAVLVGAAAEWTLQEIVRGALLLFHMRIHTLTIRDSNSGARVNCPGALPHK